MSKLLNDFTPSYEKGISPPTPTMKYRVVLGNIQFLYKCNKTLYGKVEYLNQLNHIILNNSVNILSR